MLPRVALVTGAAQGIGRAIAQRLARDGCNIALNDVPTKTSTLSALREELLQRHPQQQVVVSAADVSSEPEVRGMFEKVVGELGGLDILVANAGKALTLKPLIDVPIGDADELYASNIRTTMLCFQYAARQMIKQGRGGRIIGASSLAGKEGYPWLSTYSFSKFAVRGLTQAAAVELGPHDITVNSYAPAVIRTAMTEVLPEGTGISIEDFFADQASQAPLKRNIDTEDVAALVSFLVSEGGRNITGQTLSVDGGRVRH